MRFPSEKAVALIMTLIMLSVITVVSVAFLALTQRERSSVSQSSQQSDSEIIADIAFERAKGEINTLILASNNLLVADLMVSRNFINTNGFVSGSGETTNINYDYYRAGGSLSLQDVQQNIANLYYDPRPPVFVNIAPPGQPEQLEFRFYLDLNRNRRYDTNGLWPVIYLDAAGKPIASLTDAIDFVGDPEWIGVLENPDLPHSRANRFVGRYAFIALPIGKSLDINFIHNQAKRLTPAATLNSFYRNQGVGSWEINLAAFLVDLNTNFWQPLNNVYSYNTSPTLPSSGTAFDHAREFLNVRATTPVGGLIPDTIDKIFSSASIYDRNFLERDFVDQYSDGPLEVTGKGTNDDDKILTIWPGADNPKHFFTPNDFFDVFAPPDDNFRNALLLAGQRDDSYDRYTFYRMLAQLSTDSASEKPQITVNQLRRKMAANKPEEFVAEPAGKININYDNLDYRPSQLVSWDGNKFFNVVADILLRSELNFSITNIPIYPTNYYGVAVHRVLQMAANILDATTPTNALPSVFRPVFGPDPRVPKGIMITGYQQNSNAVDVLKWADDNPYGIPIIIGAKKGYPNFNEFSMDTAFLIARKLQLQRKDGTSTPHATNEMYIVGISNYFGVEAWNSYTQQFVGQMEMVVTNYVTYTISNTAGIELLKRTDRMGIVSNFTIWPGFKDPFNANSSNTLSFKVPLSTNLVTLPDSAWRPKAPPPYTYPPFDSVHTNIFVSPSDFYLPDWTLSISNRLIYLLSIVNTNGVKQLIDYAQFITISNTVDLTKALLGQPSLAGANYGAADDCWNTNRSRTGPNPLAIPTRGDLTQIQISVGALGAGDWNPYTYTRPTDIAEATRVFGAFLYGTNYPGLSNDVVDIQAPYTPARKVIISSTWQANDPLVHQLPEHLKDNLAANTKTTLVRPSLAEINSDRNLGKLNGRYRPWGGRPTQTPGTDPNEMKSEVKDASVRQSDNWEFPNGKFPSIGWLGRVHRGTPWQTIYLKSAVADKGTWQRTFLDARSHPTNDWRLLDIFTVAMHPNASHGQLSINQTNLAAWSAILSGVVVLTNRESSPLDPFAPQIGYGVIEPNSPELLGIFQSIMETRTNMPGQTFRRLGDLLATPKLSDASPFITTAPEFGGTSTLTDSLLERIPQQILSLLKVGDPRFVVYAYGQTLRPADNSILTSGPFIGMCTNYQITGETVTRTVLQIEETAARPRPMVETFNILRRD